MLWLAGGRVRAALEYLVPAGRMALTNYLAVSIVVTIVVLLTGTYGRVSIAMATVLDVASWLIEVAWSIWWLRRRELGAFEWIWRTLSHGSRCRQKAHMSLTM